MFVVEMVGIYRQGIVVVAETETGAREGIEAYLKEPDHALDADGYHDYEVSHLVVGETPEVVATFHAGRRGMPYAWVEG